MGIDIISPFNYDKVINSVSADTMDEIYQEFYLNPHIKLTL